MGRKQLQGSCELQVLVPVANRGGDVRAPFEQDALEHPLLVDVVAERHGAALVDVPQHA